MSFDPIAACKQAGFAEAFLLPNVSYADWTRHRSDGAFHSNTDFIRDDPTVDYPWANACLIAVWAFQPFDDPSVVPADIRAERAETPYRTQLLQAGIGCRMDNQLWYYPPYGTNTALWGVMLQLEEPIAFTPPHANEPVCDHCGRCDRACFGALHHGTFDWKNCIRSYMENEPLPDRFLPELNSFSGCQRCQDVCPKNPSERIPVPETVRSALDPVRIVQGDDKAALELLGKNRRKQLLRQAIVLCANRNRTDALPYLLRLQAERGEMFAAELNYAIKHLQIAGNVVE